MAESAMGLKDEEGNCSRTEIDTSAPFESVKEAVTRFGGIGFWKPTHNNKLPELEENAEEIDIDEVEEEAAMMEKELIVKERETLDVLKELESTKKVIEDLKLKLQKEERDVDAMQEKTMTDNNKLIQDSKENIGSRLGIIQNESSPECWNSSSTPGLILMELKQAKLNLTRTTNDLAEIRASVDMYNKKLEEERISLEKTRERLTLNFSKVSSLEEELGQTKLRLQLAKVRDAGVKGSNDNPSDIARELQRLSCETEEFKRIGEAAKSEVLRTISEIEHTKAMIKTAEIRLVAARKMKAAARAAEAVALAEIKALSNRDKLPRNVALKHDGVTISFEEYNTLTCKAQDAEERSNKRVVDAMLQVDEANLSKVEFLKKVEEATEEVKSSKKALEEALNRVEAANRGKLAVEEALRKWRSDGQKRRPVHNSTKFKNPCPSHHRRDPRLLDVNGLNLVNDGPEPVLKPTLSIGQILSRKLMLPEEYENGTLGERSSLKRKVSLGQMLSKCNRDTPYGGTTAAEKARGQRQFCSKRKKFGFARFSLLLAKQNKRKKKPTLDLR